MSCEYISNLCQWHGYVARFSRYTMCHYHFSLAIHARHSHCVYFSKLRFCDVIVRIVIKVSKGAKIRNRYNQVPHLTKDTNGIVTNLQLDTTNESQEVSPFPAGDA